MSRKIVAGNWKMNMNAEEARALFEELKNGAFPNQVKVILSPPAIYLAEFAKETKNVHLASQNVSSKSNGAFTGEISASMLESIDVNYCLVGHSERRQYFYESNEMLAEKVKQLIAFDLCPIFCCGESLAERESGKEKEVILKQLKEGLFFMDENDFSKVIIAYEPIWAIGTGVTASSDQAQEMHAFIRRIVADHYNDDVAKNISILYGGSCKPENAVEIFSKPDVDGGLIGGAALDANSFMKIIHSF